MFTTATTSNGQDRSNWNAYSRAEPTLFRPAPHNLEAEQALLGAILFNNEAMDRVSSFLEPDHFYDPLHQQIYETAAKLIHAGKQATPITLKTYFDNAEPISPTLTVPQYLGTLAANATTIINAEEYGRTVYDLATRRALIIIGEDMVDCAYDSPVDFAPQQQLDELQGQIDRLRGVDQGHVVVSAASFADVPVPPRTWHVEGLIPARTVTLLYGDGGTGKSLLALQLGACTANGHSWLGHDVRRGRVLYVGAEDELAELHRRIADIAGDLSVTLEQFADLMIVPLAGEDAILATAAKNGIVTPTVLWQRLCRIVAECRPGLIVFDTLADLFGGDENSRAQARQFVTLLRGLAIKNDSTALLLAHPSLTGMSSGSGLSGSTGWSNSVRSRLYLERVKENGTEPDPNLRVLSTKKANYGPVGLEFRLRWHDGVFTTDTDSTAGLLALSVKQAQADAVFLELVAAYEAEGRPVSARPSSNFAPTVFAKDDRAKGVRKKGLTDAMNRLFKDNRIRVEEFGPPSKRRSKLVIA